MKVSRGRCIVYGSLGPRVVGGLGGSRGPWSGEGPWEWWNIGSGWGGVYGVAYLLILMNCHASKWSVICFNLSKTIRFPHDLKYAEGDLK